MQNELENIAFSEFVSQPVPFELILIVESGIVIAQKKGGFIIEWIENAIVNNSIKITRITFFI